MKKLILILIFLLPVMLSAQKDKLRLYFNVMVKDNQRIDTTTYPLILELGLGKKKYVKRNLNQIHWRYSDIDWTSSGDSTYYIKTAEGITYTFYLCRGAAANYHFCSVAMTDQKNIETRWVYDPTYSINPRGRNRKHNR